MLSGSREGHFAMQSTPSTPHGLTSGAINFFMAASEGSCHTYLDSISSMGSFAMQPGPTQPVYGPSKVPRHQQFVDLVTDSSLTSSFVSINGKQQQQQQQQQQQSLTTNSSNVSAPVDNTYLSMQGVPEAEMQNHMMYYQHPMVTLQTPDNLEKPQLLRQISVGAPTPSSGMGMTASPSTVCRYITHTTPGSALFDETCTRTYLRKVPGSYAHAVGVPADGAMNMVMNSSLTAVPAMPQSTKAALDDNPTSLASELEQAYEEQVHEYNCNMVVTPNRIGMKVNATEGDNAPMAGSREVNGEALNKEGGECEKRRGKDRRHARGKNKQKGDNCSSNNAATIHGGAAFHNGFPVLQSEYEVHSEFGGKQFVHTLCCHGGRETVCIFSGCVPKGKHVIFEADRGVDLGEVVSVKEFSAESGDASSIPLVVRCARPEEVADWKGALLAKEDEALAECRLVCKQLNLTIHVVGAAYQFDRQKLTFIYESEERVDFRSLLQVMFSKFRCRIWMERRSASFTGVTSLPEE
uniref:PSP1 C-terminal domain-containing protein n=1 Tax=Trypanosoma congolense (strain IL3000) TaxID=1068625 RepID=G0V048_TRYCI|nr:conserved hypothetical protein [Trypanosoma congolense IL3000]